LITGPRVISQAASPDENAAGLIQETPDALRYDGHFPDPDEVSGIVTSMIPRGARVLEVGCGTGSLSRIVADTCGAEVVGIEPDSHRAERARARGLQVHTDYLSPDLIQKIGSFDVVLLADVLEHVPNPQTILLLSRQALKSGGAVVISVPNVAHWSVRVDVVRGRFRYQPSGIMDVTHLRWFTLDTLKGLIAASGFKITSSRATAGMSLADNVHRRPWRWLPTYYRTSLLRFGCRHWPTLLGCQHVVKAEML
jgi:methionine biosynthesis protein MetW